MSTDPPRLFESDPAARDAIDAARSDMPDAKRLAKIGAAAAAAAAATATAATTASAGTALAVKIIAGVVFVGAAVGVGAYVNSTRAVSPAASATASATASASAAATASAVTASASASASVSASTVPVPVPAPVPPAVDEMTLLDEAQRVLPADPAKALSLCDKDAAANPRGSMAQEREVLAIDALMRLKRPDEAAIRAKHFHMAWPDSAHGRRVDALVNLH